MAETERFSLLGGKGAIWKRSSGRAVAFASVGLLKMSLPYARPSEKKTVVLVVEDEVFIRMAIADYVRDAGYKVIEANSADEALEYLRLPNEIGLVFSDVRMPGSIDGLELARRIRLLNPCLPVILTSGHLPPGEAGGIPFLTKPYNLPDVAAKIAAVLNQIADGEADNLR